MPTRRNRWEAGGPVAGVLGAACVALALLAGNAPGEPPPLTHRTERLERPRTRFVEFPGRRELTDRLIVRTLGERARRATLGDALAAAAIEGDARARLGPDVLDHDPHTDEYLLRAPTGLTLEAYAERLIASGDYAYVEPDWLLFPGASPDDPLLPAQWSHTVIECDAAWDLTTGSPAIICALCDTGVQSSHPDLAGVLVPGADSSGFGPAIPEIEGGIVDDAVGHGTAVAGCMGAVGNNAQGIAGVGWNLRLMPVRVSDAPDGSAPLSSILKGARWAAENGARVINCSYEGVNSASVQSTGEYVASLGAVLFWSAGNFQQNWTDFDHADVVVVGATDQFDARADFSAYGPGVDLFAPGSVIVTTALGSAYDVYSGTSFASAIASGVAGLVLSRNPALTPDQLGAILATTCEDLGPPGEDADWGWGRINAYRAVLGAEPPSSPPGPFTIISPLDEASGVSVVPSLDWSESSEAGFYRVLVDDDPSFVSPEVDATATDSFLGIDAGVLEFGTTYHWTVAAQNLLGSETWTPQVASFTTGPLPAPEPFSLLAPGPGATNVSPEVRLTWSIAAFAASYRVTVAPDEPGALPVVEFLLDASSTSLILEAGTLAYDTQYVWNVTAINDAGERGASPGLASFVTAPPPIPAPFSLLSPENGTGGLPPDPTFAWTPSEGGDLYVVEVADSPEFVEGLMSWDVPAPNIVLELPPDSLKYEHAYFWRVVALNVSGERLASPAVASFTTQAYTPSPCPGDITADGLTNVYDFVALLQNFGVTEDATRDQGDLNADGAVDALDFASFVADFGCTGAVGR